MDIDLLASSFGVAYVALCLENCQIVPLSLGFVFIAICGLYLRLSLTKDSKFQLPVRRRLLSGKIPPPIIPNTTLPITTPKIDAVINQIISNILRDYLLTWFSAPLISKTQHVLDIATSICWCTVNVSYKRLQELDLFTLVFQDAIIKLTTQLKVHREVTKDEEEFQFKGYIGCCENDYDEEKHFLKLVSLSLLQMVTPKTIWSSNIFTELMSDIMANTILHPLIQNHSNPSLIYCHILTHLGRIDPPPQQRTFTQAETYEEFIAKINREESTDKLRQLRYKVIGEIMQAMMVDSLKQGNDYDGLLSQLNTKSSRLSSRNLQKYINQCKVAQAACEKRISDINRSKNLTPHYTDRRLKDADTCLLTLDEILRSPYVMPFFVQYLERQNDYGPLKLWMLVEQCKGVEENPDELYKLIKKGYNDHLIVSSPLRAHQIPRYLVRMAEAYVERKSEYWQFIYEIQNECYTMLQEQHFKPFLISSYYMDYVCSTGVRRVRKPRSSLTKGDEEPKSAAPISTTFPAPGAASPGASITTQSDSTTSDGDTDVKSDKIVNLQDELKSKEILLQTLELMDYTTVEEIETLKDEISAYRTNISRLQHHRERMETWRCGLGQWEAVVSSAEDRNRSDILFTIIVRQKLRVCEQVLPDVKHKSKYRLTQFSFNTPQQDGGAPASCLCDGKPRGRSKSYNGLNNQSINFHRYNSTGHSSPCETASVSSLQFHSVLPSNPLSKLDNISIASQDSASTILYTPSSPEHVFPRRRESSESQLDSPLPYDFKDIKQSPVSTSTEESPSPVPTVETPGVSEEQEAMETPGVSGEKDTAETVGVYTEEEGVEAVGVCGEEEAGQRFREVSVNSEGSTISVGSDYRPPVECSSTIQMFFAEENMDCGMEGNKEQAYCNTSTSQRDFPEDFPFHHQRLDSEATLQSSCSHEDQQTKTEEPCYNCNKSDDDKIRILENTRNDSMGSNDSRFFSFTRNRKSTFISYIKEASSNLIKEDNESDANNDTALMDNIPNERLDFYDPASLVPYYSGSDSEIAISEDSSDSGEVDRYDDPYLVIDIQSLRSEHPLSSLFEQEQALSSECWAEEVQEHETEKGWVVNHTLQDVQELYEKLKAHKVPRYPIVFPVVVSNKKSLSSGRKIHDTLKVEVSDFLNYVLRDSILNQSEDAYNFFNPSMEELLPLRVEKTGKLEDMDDKNKESDTMAIPFYKLVAEIFELHGYLQWIRRQMVYLVRITFGSNIERQLTRVMAWACSEPQCFSYVQLFKSTMWPNDETSVNSLTDLEKEVIRGKVRTRLLETPPQILLVLFGPSKTRKGLAKLLDTIDDAKLNKQFLYTLLELILLHLVGIYNKRKRNITKFNRFNNPGSDTCTYPIFKSGSVLSSARSNLSEIVLP